MDTETDQTTLAAAMETNMREVAKTIAALHDRVQALNTIDIAGPEWFAVVHHVAEAYYQLTPWMPAA